MKRDVKFRAWDKISSVMNEANEIHFCYKEVIFNNSEQYWRSFDNCILMQFTGLKDKNGVEIYEGDILDSGGKYGYLGELVFVCWNEDELAWCANTKDNDYRDRLRSCFSDKSVIWEVVGNIYENPDKLIIKNK